MHTEALKLEAFTPGLFVQRGMAGSLRNGSTAKNRVRIHLG